MAEQRRATWSRLVVLAAIFTTVLTTACGAVPDRPATGPVPVDPATAWADQVCGSVLAFATSATAAPDFAADADLAGVQRRYGEYLGGLIAGVRDGRAALAAAGEAPVAGGNPVRDRVRTTMTRLEQDVTGARATVDAADPTNPRAFVASVRQVESTVSAVVVPDVVGELETVPELAPAARTAAQCRKVRTLAAAVPR